MQPLHMWSAKKLLLICFAWLALTPMLTAAWGAYVIWREIRQTQGSGGIAGVSIGISDPIVLFVVAPPLVLAAAWLIARSLAGPKTV